MKLGMKVSQVEVIPMTYFLTFRIQYQRHLVRAKNCFALQFASDTLTVAPHGYSHGEAVKVTDVPMPRLALQSPASPQSSRQTQELPYGAPESCGTRGGGHTDQFAS